MSPLIRVNINREFLYPQMNGNQQFLTKEETLPYRFSQETPLFQFKISKYKKQNHAK